MNDKKTIFEALKEVQEKMPVIGKNKQGHNSKYADLEKVWETAQPIISDAGFVVYHEGNEDEIITTIYHESGEKLSSAIKMTQTDAQKRGAEVTYYRRYNLLMLFNIIVSDEDKDAYQTPDEFKKFEIQVKDAIKKLKTATSKEELKKYWDALTPDERGNPDVESVKNEMKEQF